MSDENTLNGWKEIAAYLGKGVRSVQRWEQSLGLPIHRIRTPDGQIVYGLKTEIDEWRRLRDEVPADEDAPTAIETTPATGGRLAVAARWWPVGVAILAFISGLGFGQWRNRAIPIPSDFLVQGRQLQALDRHGRIIWTHALTYEAGPSRDTYGNEMGAVTADLDDDGVPEVLVPIRRVEERGKLSTSDELLALTQQGRLLWRVSPDISVTYGDTTFAAPWRLEMFVASNTTPRRVFVAFSHHTWAPGIVFEVSRTGAARPVFFQDSRILRLAAWHTPSGNLLAMGGVSRSQKPLLTLWADSGPPASFVSGPGETCAGCPTAGPVRAYEFETADLVAAYPKWHPAVTTLTVRGTDLSVHIQEGGDRNIQGHSTWTLSPDLTLANWGFSDTYWPAHDRYFASGTMDHLARDCPERDRPRQVNITSSTQRMQVSVRPSSTLSAPSTQR